MERCGTCKKSLTNRYITWISNIKRVLKKKKDLKRTVVVHCIETITFYTFNEINFVQLYNIIRTAARIYAVNIRLTYTNRFSFSFKYKHSDRRCSKDGLEHSWQVSYVSKTRSFRCVCLETDRCPPLYDYRPYEKFWFLNDANVSAACVSRGEVRATLNVRSVKYKRTVARNLLPA